MLRRSRNQADEKPSSASAPSRHDAPASSHVELSTDVKAWVDTERTLFGEILLEMELVTPDQLTDALAAQRDDPKPLGELLRLQGHLSEDDVADALAKQFGLEVADLRTSEPEPKAIAMVPGDLARRHGIVPFRSHGDQLVIVTAQPGNGAAIQELTDAAGAIGLLVGVPDDIERVLTRSYSELTDAARHVQAFELTTQKNSTGLTSLTVDENAPVVQLVSRVLNEAVRSRASDVHIEPVGEEIRVRFRIDGALSEALRVPASLGSPMTSRIKVLAQLNIVERRRPQDGQFSIEVDGRPIDIRTSVVATLHGEKVVMRLLDKTRSLIGLTDLGFSEAVEKPYLEIVRAPLGMMLCTGPTGSGKTTTLYATLTEINDDRRNVVTLEDPVEYEFPGVNQMQISESAGITFAGGLRGILRQDPDVILVGEIRDVETARLATQAALTGHFVLSSLHAVDAASALHRFTDMGIEPFLVASAINGIVGQRLLRRTCDNCRETMTPTASEIALVEREGIEPPTEWSKGAGCNLCNHTGYQGRIGVYELLVVSDAIRALVVEKATHSQIRRQAVAEGMSTMQREALGLVADGITTVEEVLRSVHAPTAAADNEESETSLNDADANGTGSAQNLMELSL